MEIYNFKTVPEDEIDKLRLFLDNYWKKNHVLVKSENLMKFQHLDDKGKFYHFIVAENIETKEYDAIVGYIPTSQYDPNLNDQRDYWGAIWKIRDDIENPSINAAGLYIWKSILNKKNANSYAAIAISESAKQIYRAFRIPVEEMKCYYLLNDRIEKYYVADNVTSDNYRADDADETYSVRWIKDISILQLEHSYRPLKTITYLINRYQKHPIYKYRFLGVYHKGELVTIFVTRTIVQNGSKVIRIVDAYGKIQGKICHQLNQLLYEEEAEYIDLLNYGIDPEVIKDLGFNMLDYNQDLIIPNYFEPFERRNVKIEIAYKADFNYVAFKGDADQDRPNIL